MKIDTPQDRRKAAEEFVGFELKKYKNIERLEAKRNPYALQLDTPIEWPKPEKKGQLFAYNFKDNENLFDTYYFHKFTIAFVLWLFVLAPAAVAIEQHGKILGAENYLLFLIPALYFSLRTWQAGQEKYSGKLVTIEGTVSRLFCYIPTGSKFFSGARFTPTFSVSIKDAVTNKVKKFKITRVMYHALKEGATLMIHGYPARQKVESLTVYYPTTLEAITERQMIDREKNASRKELLKGILLSPLVLPLVVVVVLGMSVFVAMIVRALIGN